MPAAHADPAPTQEQRIVFQSSALPDLGGDPTLTAAQKQFRTRLLIGGAVGGVLAYGASHWWQDSMSSSFRTVNEGWFGQNTYTGGADKLGHMYSTYVGTRLLTDAFEWAGNDRETASWLAAATAWGAMLAVEVGDGYSQRFRFSKEDLIMNTLGTGLGLLMEKQPDLDKLVDFRLMYWPSSDARRLNQVDIVDDHSGQTYLLALKASGVPALRRIEPLRYFELALGYGTRGYEPNAGGERSRHVYYGISLNVAEILGATVFGDSKGSRAQRISDGVLEVFQIPGTAALADHRL
ncbi:DUF2279 domain-containing protein [Sulfurimicrobium lacus]|uniref:DUF2279 domain-containing protein n=1 Tax=Sulfurimicrobium lacus TaxID=2715678 RepID=UPI001567C4F7|nr:DUF2279 domain-containing protein [Sulfurimicrobium lacus]